MPVDNWIIAISVGVAVLAFVALVIFLIMTLVSVRAGLKDVEQKIHTLDPLFRVVDGVSHAIEKRSHCARQLTEEIEEDERCYRKETKLDTAMEVAEWALVGLVLWQKIKDRRR